MTSLPGRRLVDWFECPDWLLHAAQRAGCVTVRDLGELVRRDAGKAGKSGTFAEVAARVLYEMHFYRDWDECERLGAELVDRVEIEECF